MSFDIFWLTVLIVSIVSKKDAERQSTCRHNQQHIIQRENIQKTFFLQVLVYLCENSSYFLFEISQDFF